MELLGKLLIGVLIYFAGLVILFFVELYQEKSKLRCLCHLYLESARRDYGAHCTYCHRARRCRCRINGVRQNGVPGPVGVGKESTM